MERNNSFGLQSEEGLSPRFSDRCRGWLKVFAPAPGSRGYDSGNAWGNGYFGFYWHNKFSGIYGVFMNFNTTSLYPGTTTGRGSGLQLRCLSE